MSADFDQTRCVDRLSVENKLGVKIFSISQLGAEIWGFEYGPHFWLWGPYPKLEIAITRVLIELEPSNKNHMVANEKA